MPLRPLLTLLVLVTSLANAGDSLHLLCRLENVYPEQEVDGVWQGAAFLGSGGRTSRCRLDSLLNEDIPADGNEHAID